MVCLARLSPKSDVDIVLQMVFYVMQKLLYINLEKDKHE